MTNPFLKETIIKYNSILESIEEAYFVIDLYGRLHFFNDECCNLLGYARSELNNMTIQDFTTAGTLYKISEIYRETKESGKVVTMSDYEIIHKDENLRTLEVTGLLIKDKSGTHQGFHGVAKDGTKQWGLRMALEESEGKYRDLVENINEVIYQTDNHGVVTYVSPSVESAGGYTQAEIIGHPFTDFVYEEDLNGRMDQFQKILQGAKNVTIYRMKTKDEGSKWVRTGARPIYENGYAVGIRGVLTDITDTIEMQEKLCQSEYKYSSILEDIEEGYFEVDLKGNLLFFNDSICKILGYTRDELTGINHREIITPEPAKKTFQTFNEIYRTGKPKGLINFEFIKKSGESGIGELSANLMMNNKGEPIGFRGVARDVTEHRLTERAWKQSNFIVNASKDWMTLINRKYEYMAANDAFCRGHCKTRDEIIGSTVAEIWGEKTFSQSIKNNIDRCLAGEEIDHQTSFDKESFKSRQFGITYYPFRNEKGLIDHVVIVSREITKRMRAENRMKQSLLDLQDALKETIYCLVSAFEIRDPYTAGHQRRVAGLARTIAKKIALSDDQIEGLSMAALIHDIGKISVPAEILSKPSKLTKDEYSMIKQHSQSGYDILKDVKFPWPIARMILEHHERIDGSGYPNALTGENLLLESQILAVADVVEAMVSHRPYRPALGVKTALEEIENNKGTLYNADAVDACLRLFRGKEFQLEKVSF